MSAPRQFVVIGQRAGASPDFHLSDIPSTSGRLDVLLRCLRAALLVSHGVRCDSVVYLALLGDAERPRVIRFDGPSARYMRPDERSLATVVKKALATDCETGGGGFVDVRNGISVASAGLELVWDALAGSTLYVLEEGAPDLRGCELQAGARAFVLGDHLGLTAATRERLAALGARPISVGPLSLHAEDVIVLLNNELDRRSHGAG